MLANRRQRFGRKGTYEFNIQINPTNATLLFGFGDTWQECIRHLLILRRAQDQSGGFSCFIPLPFQPGAGHFIETGFTPARRDSRYRIQEIYAPPVPTGTTSQTTVKESIPDR